jgi:hypothetical protein
VTPEEQVLADVERVTGYLCQVGALGTVGLHMPRDLEERVVVLLVAAVRATAAISGMSPRDALSALFKASESDEEWQRAVDVVAAAVREQLDTGGEAA